MVLKTVHNLAAWKTGQDMLRLSDDEADFIANPAMAVLRYYGLDFPEGYGVWGNLLIAVASVYGPRVSNVLGITSEITVDTRPSNSAAPVKTAPAPAPANEGNALMAAMQGAIH